MADEKQDGQKTLVAFVVGLLIGGILVWAFSGPTTDTAEMKSEKKQDTEEVEKGAKSDSKDGEESEEMEAEVAPAPVLSVGEGAVVVNDQPASASIVLDSATYPISEGWIGVREFNNEQLGFILGVVRFSESQGLVPSEITLQRSTTAGNQYAIVIFTEDGDFDFSLANDVQIDTVFDTFSAK
ncbi:hypothetical protein KC926_00325 [Candidatus Kaiserbacteria bacterium]|nr:hypothetical protein [Candidatus Kaiserbacteria bacterium]